MNAEDAIHDVRERYQQLGQALNELQRRHWAAREALRLGRGGITTVSKALRISPNTVRRGIREISAGQADLQLRAITRIRKPGGGRKTLASSDRDATQSIPDENPSQHGGSGQVASDPPCQLPDSADFPSPLD